MRRIQSQAGQRIRSVGAAAAASNCTFVRVGRPSRSILRRSPLAGREECDQVFSEWHRALSRSDGHASFWRVVRRPDALRMAAFVSADEPLTAPNDRFGAAVVDFEQVIRHTWIGVREALEEIIYVRISPGIDHLVVVSDRKDIGGARCQYPHQSDLGIVQVLVFIDENTAETRLPDVPDRRILQQ